MFKINRDPSMNNKEIYAHIDILGKSYPIKCNVDELQSLKESARYLEEKMKKIRDGSKGFGIEKIAIITALNVVHEFLNIEEVLNARSQHVQDKIRELHGRIETALIKSSQLELDSAE